MKYDEILNKLPVVQPLTIVVSVLKGVANNNGSEVPTLLTVVYTWIRYAETIGGATIDNCDVYMDDM